MSTTLTVAELIAMLEKVENKTSAVEFHSISNRSYPDTVVEIKTSDYINRTTITIK